MLNTVENDLESLVSEIKIMKNSTSPYLIKFIDCFIEEKKLSIGGEKKKKFKFFFFLKFFY